MHTELHLGYTIWSNYDATKTDTVQLDRSAAKSKISPSHSNEALLEWKTIGRNFGRRRHCTHGEYPSTAKTNQTVEALHNLAAAAAAAVARLAQTELACLRSSSIVLAAMQPPMHLAERHKKGAQDGTSSQSNHGDGEKNMAGVFLFCYHSVDGLDHGENFPLPERQDFIVVRDLLRDHVCPKLLTRTPEEVPVVSLLADE